jgi:hypothetical protein
MSAPAATPRSRLGRGLLRAGLALLSTAAAVGLAELWVRWADPFGISYYRAVPRYFQGAIEPAFGPDGVLDPADRIFQQRPGVELRLREFDFLTDESGLRSAAPTGGPAPRVGEPTPGSGAWSAERWLFLGDSVTLAWGVDDGESWVRALERGARAPDGRPLEALNAGHLMYDTVQQADLLAALGPLLRPEVVALCFISNDLEPTYDQWFPQVATAGTEAGAVLPARPPSWPRVLFQRHLRGLADLWRFGREWAVIREGHGSERGPFRYYPQNWPRCREALERMVATCGELGARFVLLDHTMPPIPDLEPWAAEHGVPYVRGGFTPEEYATGIVNSAADSHANARGNALLGEKWLAGLSARGLLQRRADS